MPGAKGSAAHDDGCQLLYAAVQVPASMLLLKSTTVAATCPAGDRHLDGQTCFQDVIVASDPETSRYTSLTGDLGNDCTIQ